MSKEVLKPNIVDAPTLFVGIGGTGSKIIDKLIRLCRPEELTNINFVCMDTNVNDLSLIPTANGHTYRVQTSTTQTVGNYLDYDKDACNNWFPKNAVIYDKTVSEGAGQVRAISRLALNACIKTGRIQPLYDAIDDLFKKTGAEMKQAMRVVIASTASGGTGSGMILPLAMLIRDYVTNQYPNTSLIVRSIILLPETLNSVIKSKVERESQARNAYSTIKEINAFMMKGSGFLDSDADLKRYKDIHVDVAQTGKDELKHLDSLPFDFCFLLDGQDSNDSTMTGKDQYTTQAAQALYEQNIGPMQRSAFSIEDNIIKEMSTPGNWGRNRFGGIGASVLRYPYEKITDYIAYDWAIDAIGDENTPSKWLAYDNAYLQAKHEDEEKGKSETEGAKIETVYCSELDRRGESNNDSFSRDLYLKFTKDYQKQEIAYYNAIVTKTKEYFLKYPSIESRMKGFETFTSIEATKPEDYQDCVSAVFTLTEIWNGVVNDKVEKIASEYANSLFYNDKDFRNVDKTMVESVLKNATGNTFHPNAMRYAFYKLQALFEKGCVEAKAEKSTAYNKVQEYFNGEFTSAALKKMKFNSLAEFSRVSEDKKKLRSKKAKRIYYKDLADSVSEFASVIDEYISSSCKYEVCLKGLEFAQGISAGFKRFYDSFSQKSKNVKRSQRDLVDELKFKKGDAILNVCAEEDILKEISLDNKRNSAKSALLSDELNQKIYEAVKKNVLYDRRVKSDSLQEGDKRYDIFDDILIGYFKENVRVECPALDCTILDALRLECRMQNLRDARNECKKTGKEFEPVDPTPDAKNHHILDRKNKAKVLAAPGVQPPTHEEQRLVELCAYNSELLKDQTCNVKDLLGEIGVDSVSKYEIHFYNAIYNITPDKIVKFRAPRKTETRKSSAGIYHKAYSDYERFIGPDSTKNKVISTHIDKRWDSIAVMPELDFEYQHSRMMRIHKAFIRALVYKFIDLKEYSITRKGKKLVYKFENQLNRLENLTVSNGTLCDEFYEILDALYFSPSTVDEIEYKRNLLLLEDASDHHSFEESSFGKAFSEFKLPLSQKIDEGSSKIKIDDKSSLFDIPLAYYSCLPSSLRFLPEIENMVQAIIECLKEELEICENEDDVKFKLCDILRNECELMKSHYTKDHEYLTMSFDKADNPVIDIIVRSIDEVMKESPAPDDYENVMHKIKDELYN